MTRTTPTQRARPRVRLAPERDPRGWLVPEDKRLRATIGEHCLARQLGKLESQRGQR